jgi:6-phosphofructokinase 1
MTDIRRLAVFTSGGDSPGMNAAIRAVTRTAINRGIEVFGIRRGFDGMIDDQFSQLFSESVSGIIQRGGTILKTARSRRFMTPEGMQAAYDNLRQHEIDAVVAIGGDGTCRGAAEFGTHFDMPFIGLPGTIDNDLFGTDYTIGYDTAINTVVDAVDKIRDTAASHDRLFFVEVMGRDAGAIALMSGIGVGAEAVLIPETKTRMEQLLTVLRRGWNHRKTSMIVIVAEGDDAGGAYQIAEEVKRQFDYYDTRVTVLGHIQRGGSPSCMDRVNSSRLGVEAVEALLRGQRGVMLGLVHNAFSYTPFNRVQKHRQLNQELLRIAEILSL